MSELLIRLATLEDAEEILRIYEPYIYETAITFEVDKVPLGVYIERMKKVQAQYPWLVCELKGKIVGFAYASSYRERAAFAWDCESSVYIAKEAHRMGVATALYEKLLELLTAQGYYKVYAYITIPNEGSIGIHKKFGFEEVGTFRETGYKLGSWWNLLVMEKTLPMDTKLPKLPSSIGDLDY